MSQEGVSQQPAFYRGPAGWFSGKGPFRFIVQGERVWLPAHLTASVCSSFQHPSDGLPPSARVAALPPVRRLRAADRGAAQATPPGALRDGRQPRGREGSDGRPPCRPGMGSRSLLWCPPGSPGRSLLLGCCLVLLRLRSASQLPIPPRDGKSEIECRKLIKPLRSQEKSLPGLHKDRSDIHAVFFLLFLIEKLL